MAVKETVQSEEQKAEEKNQLDQAQNKLVGDLLSSLDLPEEKPKEEAEDKEEPKEEKPEESTGDSEETESKDEPDEEVIPKSKHEKALKHMEQRLNNLTAKLKQYESKPAENSSDSDRDRLEKMSEDQLEELRLQVREAQLDETDRGKRKELLSLERKIEVVLREAPERFNKAQLSAYNAKAEEIASDPEIEDINKAAPEIKKIAQEIYSRYPKLQRSEDGQAMALELAANHYKDINKLSVNKDKVDDLKRQNNTLKRKTALDSASHKGTVKKQVDVKALGRGASSYDREAFVRDDPRFNIDSLIPDDFKK